MSTDEEPLDEFTVHEQMRQAAIARALEALRTHYTAGALASEMPDEALPHIADATFSDGAAFVTAQTDGHLRFRQRPAAADGAVHDLRSTAPNGEVFKLFSGQRAGIVWYSQMTSADVARLAISLPEGSSLLVIQAAPIVAPHWRLAVWRVPAGRRLHSRDGYEVWDKQAFELTARIVFLTGDLCQYTREVEYLRGVQESARDIMETLRPRLVYLYGLLRSSSPDLMPRLESQLKALDQALRETEDKLTAVHPAVA